MGNSAVKFKIMPESLDTDLESVKEIVQSTIKSMGGVFDSFEEEPIAFGLKALVVSLAYPESQEIDELGNAFNEIEGVSSCEMIDYRRAIG